MDGGVDMNPEGLAKYENRKDTMKILKILFN